MFFFFSRNTFKYGCKFKWKHIYKLFQNKNIFNLVTVANKIYWVGFLCFLYEIYELPTISIKNYKYKNCENNIY